MVVCEARLHAWRDWVQSLLRALQAECVHATPEHHDQVMALVQAMVHATHLAQAGVMRHYAPRLGGLADLLPYRSASFEMDSAVTARILSQNPAIYEDIQFGNPHVAPMLEAMLQQLGHLHAQVSRGDDAARAVFRQDFLQSNQSALGTGALAEGNYSFERIAYRLADLTEKRSLRIHLPEDRPGSLRALLDVFERHGISISSLHSSRTPAGEVHSVSYTHLDVYKRQAPHAHRNAPAPYSGRALSRAGARPPRRSCHRHGRSARRRHSRSSGRPSRRVHRRKPQARSGGLSLIHI